MDNQPDTLTFIKNFHFPNFSCNQMYVQRMCNALLPLMEIFQFNPFALPSRCFKLITCAFLPPPSLTARSFDYSSMPAGSEHAPVAGNPKIDSKF